MAVICLQHEILITLCPLDGKTKFNSFYCHLTSVLRNERDIWSCRVELCSVMLTLSTELKSVKTHGGVLWTLDVLSLFTIKLIICCFFLFYLYINFKPCCQTLPLKWFYISHHSFTVEYFEPSCIPLPNYFLYFSLRQKVVLHLLLQDVVGCNISPVDGFQSRDESLSYLCNVVSKEDGSFSFLSLPSGKYTVVSD